MSVIKVATARNTIVRHVRQLSSETEVSIALLCQPCSTCYTALRIKKCLKSTSVLKSSHYEKYGRFLVTQRKPSCATTKLMLFTVSKDEWNTKEDTGKSLKNIARTALRYAKRHLSGWSDDEQWKNQARSHSRYRVMLDWRHRSVSQKKFPLNKYFYNSVATFWKHFGSIWKLVWV